MDDRRRAATVSALLVGGVVACTVATPAPTPDATRRPSVATIAPAPSPAAASSTDRTFPPSPNRLEVEVGSLDPSWIWPMLEFGSDSMGVIWSSGVLDGPVGDGAPDLWRYVPGQSEPELLWQNPERDRQLAKIAGDTDVWAFAETSSLGERWWNLWLLTAPGGDPVLLDSHPGQEGTLSLVPSFDVDAGRVAWTSFGAAEGGATASRLWMAEAPDWEPRLLAAADASVRAYWLPSLRGQQLAYVEVEIGADPSEDVRHVMLLEPVPGGEPRQLDTSGNATMPVLTDRGVIWKEPDRGFAMFNWGRLFHYSFETQTVTPLRIGPQQYVNYPSGGGRFVAMWGADSSVFAVHDLERGISRQVVGPEERDGSILRPHLAGDLLVWLHPRHDAAGTGPPAPIEYAWLPEPGADRGS